jgi:parallel beta-helix repeat protein
MARPALPGGAPSASPLAGGVRMNYANNLDIVDCNFEGNGYGIFVGGGESVRIAGNDIEGTAGAGVHISTVSGVTISGNYFESENDVSFGGPLVLRPQSKSSTGANTRPNITVWADIILNGIDSDAPVVRVDSGCCVRACRFAHAHQVAS